MSWNQAQVWCDEGGLALPTEAQWEYAASGPQNLAYPWGDEYELVHCVSGAEPDAEQFKFPEVVGMLGEEGASWCGVQNMGGNVREWCRDIFTQDFAGVTAGSLDPLVTAGTSLRVRRGGYYTSLMPQCRTDGRFPDPPDKRNVSTGFRAVFELPPE